MSLRHGRYAPYDQPPKENLPADVAKAHTLMTMGSFYGCRQCGQLFSTAVSRRDAEIQIAIHRKAVIELIEDTRMGRSNYD